MKHKQTKETNNTVRWTYKNISVRCGHCGQLRMKLNAIKINEDKLVIACHTCTPKFIKQQQENL